METERQESQLGPPFYLGLSVVWLVSLIPIALVHTLCLRNIFLISGETAISFGTVTSGRIPRAHDSSATAHKGAASSFIEFSSLHQNSKANKLQLRNI